MNESEVASNKCQIKSDSIDRTMVGGVVSFYNLFPFMVEVKAI